jgi:AraC-type transcriptional regulator N-terminus
VEPERTSVIGERERSSGYQQALDLLLALTKKMAPGEGRTSTSIPFLSLIRHTHHIPPIPVVLTPAFCLILQGTKQLHFGQEILEAQAGDYLASMVALPAFAQITDATQPIPYLGLRLDFTIQEVASVVMEADITVKPQEKKRNGIVNLGM